ncbi:mechanosensitive ion channel domain-containing protein [Massilia sp. W12]|uniref:mechanosensitive ion channel family protein n=1 Tax=Massilia sp. W12 TaxID=3126507 RepID=UPI0030D05F66
MNQHNLLANLLADIWSDVRNPLIFWQLAVLLVCAGLGWWLGRRWRAHLLQGGDGHALPLSREHVARLVTPLTIFLLIVLARVISARWNLRLDILRIAVPLAGAMVAIRVVFFLLRRVFARAGQVGNNLLLFEKVFALLVWLALALYLTGSWPELIDFFADTRIPLGRHHVSLLSILQAGVSALLTVLVALWAGAEIESRLMEMEGVHLSLRVVVSRAVRACLVLVAVLLSLTMVGIDLTVLSVFGGALGVGIGLGLQKIASSYVSGFVILLERSLKIGDMISVDRFNGRVTQINTRYTVLQGLDGVETIVPNDMLVSGVVQNFSLTDTSLRIGIRLTVPYNADVESLIPQLEAVAATVPRVTHEPPPQAMLVRFAEDGLELELGFWIVDPENGRGGVSSDVSRAILRLLREQGIDLPYPQRDVHLKNGPTSSKG